MSGVESWAVAPHTDEVAMKCTCVLTGGAHVYADKRLAGLLEMEFHIAAVIAHCPSGAPKWGFRFALPLLFPQ
jgi:hypothetical protein